ncbi:hypothetical protein VTK56DRAFT_4495 [Thermocarpiscus australiensis]
MTRHTVQILSSGWEFKCETDEKWLPVSQVPSNVHTELMRHGLIPDPLQDLNELEVAWVAERGWRYRTIFVTPGENQLTGTSVDLVFEGLDTFATVTLNGKVILVSDNMFVEHRIDIREFLANNAVNSLEIAFEPARRRGLDLVKAHPEHDFIVHQTEVSRGPVRKTQCHWGWDWGPILLTCGPWKPVRLETYVSRIEDIRVDYHLHMDQGTPTLLEATIHGHIIGPASEIQLELLYGGEEVISLGESGGASRGGTAVDIPRSWRYKSSTIKLESPQLWWPRGYGGQHLYELQMRSVASDGSTVLAEERQTIGFRQVELVQEPDEFGQSFYFRINGVDIFSGGSCWIPADSFLTRIESQRYRDWIQLLAEGNQNMVRVWGGGVYESEDFYRACDELGVLVWQDFMFACASYPTYPEFLGSVETEARQNVRRLRRHPSLILWCGNNEDYQLIERYGLEYNFTDDKDPQSWLKSTFPARYIYECLLPRIVREESPGAMYHPGSPWGNGTSTTLKVDPTVGDVHQWNLWNGEARPLQLLPRMGGRFVSEFGMQASPHLDTIRRFVQDPRERYPGSATLDFHNKAVTHTRRQLAYLAENFRLEHAGQLPAFVHLTQVLQADGVAWAYKSWRRHWGSAGSRRCGGVLVWQLNDCWPAVSWAVVDYYLVKKPAYYAIRRAMQPLAVGVARKFHDCTTRPADELWRRNTGHVDPRRALTDIEFDAWVVSSELESVKARLVVRFVSIASGRDVRPNIEKEVDVQPNGCTEVLVGRKFEWDDVTAAERRHFVIHASLWVGGLQVSSDTSWPDPIKYLDFSDRGVRVNCVSQGLVEISSEKPVKGFVFSEKQGVKVSDNGFDVIPGDEPRLVRIEGEVGSGGLPWTFVGC